MVRYFSYSLSGRGVLNVNPYFIISLLKMAGIIFSFHAKFNKVKDQLLFFTIQEISQEIKNRAQASLQGEGFAGAEIKSLGNYLGR